MNKHLIILGIAILLICVGLSGCTEISSESDRFIGTWTIVEKSGMWIMGDELIFFSDGTFSNMGLLSQYELKEGVLIVNQAVVLDYLFSNGDTMLNLSYTAGESSGVYAKQ